MLYTASHMYYEKNSDHPETASFLTVFSIGVIKELWDKKFDWGDIIANLAGIGIGRAIND